MSVFYSVLNALSEYTYFYQKILFHTLLLLVFLKIVKSLQCVLKNVILSMKEWMAQADPPKKNPARLKK